MPYETDFEMAARHVREGEIHVARQSDLIEHLRHDGHDTKQAEELLAEFEAILAEQKKHLEFVRARERKSTTKL